MRRDRQDHNAYQRQYRQKHATGRGAGRPPLEDRKIHLSLRLKSSIVGRMNRMLLEATATGIYPWRTQSQQYEDIIIRGLETYRGNESVDEALQYLHAVQHSEAISRHRKEAQAAYNVTNIEIKELRGIGATDQALRYFWATYAAFERMSPHTWRDWFLQRMREDHADLFARRPQGISLDLDGALDSGETHRVKPARLLKHVR
jgi:hypothetical protein